VTTGIMVFVLGYVLIAWWSTPIFGFGADGPTQPIAFPHNVHVQDNGIQCEFCHRNVTKGIAATIPAVEQCLFCHTTVTGESNPEIAKLLRFAGLDAAGDTITGATPEPINWERVHRLPDHTQFVHEPHIRFFGDPDGEAPVQIEVQRSAQELGIGVLEASCTVCHGEIREMTKVKQERSLKMGDCVDCHRDNNAPTDCTTCHY